MTKWVFMLIQWKMSFWTWGGRASRRRRWCSWRKEFKCWRLKNVIRSSFQKPNFHCPFRWLYWIRNKNTIKLGLFYWWMNYGKLSEEDQKLKAVVRGSALERRIKQFFVIGSFLSRGQSIKWAKPYCFSHPHHFSPLPFPLKIIDSYFFQWKPGWLRSGRDWNTTRPMSQL